MYSVRCDFNYIRSYTEALKAWQDGIIFPKDRKLNNPALPRGLVNVRKRHMTIELASTGEIILRLYEHPVVTWHQDNSFTLCAHNTRSTVAFAEHCTPDGVWVCSRGGHFAVLCGGLHGARLYRVGDSTTFRQRDGNWEPDQITPWSIPCINRERAEHAFMETNYKEFRLWFKTYIQMSEPSPERKYTDNPMTISMLHDRKWRELVARLGPRAWNQPALILHNIRHTIYVEYDCIEHKQVPFLGRKEDLT